ncbi:hypothetical protein KSP40_PGU004858 [Platanthera guangdongensis]|uniref:Uncharacterized protein n=1 Tax=Platanthera guangdongensis TaxID=2320717 RepID=A0ABR2MHY1_9ASPA
MATTKLTVADVAVIQSTLQEMMSSMDVRLRNADALLHHIKNPTAAFLPQHVSLPLPPSSLFVQSPSAPPADVPPLLAVIALPPSPAVAVPPHHGSLSSDIMTVFPPALALPTPAPPTPTVTSSLTDLFLLPTVASPTYLLLLLLTAQSTCTSFHIGHPLTKAGRLQALYIRSTGREFIEVKPNVRIPRTFRRFCGLMVQLLEKHKITAEGSREKLLALIKNPITDHLPVNSRKIGLSHSSDKVVRMSDYVAAASDNVNFVFVVGAMSHGVIDKGFAEDFISISNYPQCSLLHWPDMQCAGAEVEDIMISSLQPQCLL